MFNLQELANDEILSSEHVVELLLVSVLELLLDVVDRDGQGRDVERLAAG